MNRKVVGNAFEMESIFGDLTKLEGSSNDLLALLQKTRPDKLPALYACCGTDDFLYQENQTFRKACEAGGVKLEYLEDPNEAHTWSYWDLRIQSVLQWLDQQST